MEDTWDRRPDSTPPEIYLAAAEALKDATLWALIEAEKELIKLIQRQKRFERHNMYKRATATTHVDITTKHFTKLGTVKVEPLTRSDFEADPLLWTLTWASGMPENDNRLYPLDSVAYATYLLDHENEHDRVDASFTGLIDVIGDLAAIQDILQGFDASRPCAWVAPADEKKRLELRKLLQVSGMLSHNESRITGQFRNLYEDCVADIEKNTSYDRLDMTDAKLSPAAVRLQAFCEKAPWPRGVTDGEERLQEQSIAHRALREFWQALRQARLEQMRTNNKKKTPASRVSPEGIDGCLEARLLSKFKGDAYLEQIQDEIRELSQDKARTLMRRKLRAEAAVNAKAVLAPRTEGAATSPKNTRIDKKKRKRDNKKDRTQQQDAALALIREMAPRWFEDEEDNNDVDEPAIEDEILEEPVSPGDRIPINRASQAVLGRIFRKDQTAFRWQDFVAAMYDAGYSVTSVAGSHHKFVKAEGKGKGSIIVPRPHNHAAAMEDWNIRPLKTRLTVDVHLRYQSFELRGKRRSR